MMNFFHQSTKVLMENKIYMGISRYTYIQSENFQNFRKKSFLKKYNITLFEKIYNFNILIF